jgi:hypothetical protein
MRRVDHVRRNRSIVVEEFGPQRLIGDDAADLGRRQVHHLPDAGLQTTGSPRPESRRSISLLDVVSSWAFSVASLRTSAEPTMPRCPAM